MSSPDIWENVYGLVTMPTDLFINKSAIYESFMDIKDLNMSLL